MWLFSVLIITGTHLTLLQTIRIPETGHVYEFQTLIIRVCYLNAEFSGLFTNVCPPSWTNLISFATTYDMEVPEGLSEHVMPSMSITLDI